MSIGLILIILLIVFAIGGLPNWGYHSAGYWPSGVGVVLLILLIFFVASGRL